MVLPPHAASPGRTPPKPLPHSRGLCPSPPRFEGPQEGLHPPAHRGAHPPCHRVSRGCRQAGAGGLGPRVQALLVAELRGARGSAGARGARGGAGVALTTQAACSASLSPAALGSHHTMWQRKVPGALAMMKAKARTSRPTPMKDRKRTRHSHSTASVWGHGGHWGAPGWGGVTPGWGGGTRAPRHGEGLKQHVGGWGHWGTTGGEAAVDIGAPVARGRGIQGVIEAQDGTGSAGHTWGVTKVPAREGGGVTVIPWGWECSAQPPRVGGDPPRPHRIWWDGDTMEGAIVAPCYKNGSLQPLWHVMVT